MNNHIIVFVRARSIYDLSLFEWELFAIAMLWICIIILCYYIQELQRIQYSDYNSGLLYVISSLHERDPLEGFYSVLPV